MAHAGHLHCRPQLQPRQSVQPFPAVPELVLGAWTDFNLIYLLLSSFASEVRGSPNTDLEDQVDKIVNGWLTSGTQVR
jgi:hypothetical protein